jgi:putative PIN family toxin of toxin-antitoxin system
MRVVLDPNVVISALLSPGGSPAEVLRLWLEGAYDLVVCDQLLSELDKALHYRRLSRQISDGEATELIALLRRSATVVDDPSQPSPVRCADPGDDYLIALAESTGALIVSGHRHLLDLVDEIPVYAPRAFLEFVALQPENP